MALLLLVTPSISMAFKVNMHVYISQQVINDVTDDGFVEIQFEGEALPRKVKVPDDVVNALRLHPEAYRSGNIGPDIFPDFYTGFLKIHAGHPNEGANSGKWQTDDWLKFLLASGNEKINPETPTKTCNEANGCYKTTITAGDMTPEQLAFVYGFAGHAAGDVFAHTYVNNYTGDIYNIFDEMDAGLTFDDAFVEEERHNVLENFMLNYQPPIKDNTGKELGPIENLVKAPTEFIRNRMILSDDIFKHNVDAGSGHLASVYKIRQLVNGALADEFRWLDVNVTKYVVYYLSCKFSSCIELNDKQAAKFFDIGQKLHKTWNKNNNFDEFQKMKNDLTDIAAKHAIDIAGTKAAMENHGVYLYGKIRAFDNKVNEIIQKNLELSGIDPDSCGEICEAALVCPPPVLLGCRPSLSNPFKQKCDYYTPPCPNVCNDVCEANPVYLAVKTQLGILEASRDRLDRDIDDAVSIMQRHFNDLTASLLDGLYIESALFDMILDTAQVITADLNAFRAHRDNWVNDIDLAMNEFVIANEQFMNGMMIGASTTDTTKPLQDWKDCWMPSILGVPSTVSVNACTIREHYNNIQERKTKFRNYLLRLNPTIGDLLDRFNKNMDDIRLEGLVLLNEWSTNLLSVNAKKMYESFKGPVDDAKLNAVFSQENTSSGVNKGLLVFDNMAERIRAEMGVDPASTDQVFDPDKFAPIKNAITLAKLALLDGAGLNDVAGFGLYPVIADRTTNVLVGAVRSIDGNHQWMKVAPPYPRLNGDTVWDNISDNWRFTGSDTGVLARSFGYDEQFGTKGGMKIWVDCRARNEVFRKIFQGPLQPALEVPATLNFADVLPVDHKLIYPVTVDNPFPSHAKDSLCEGDIVDTGGGNGQSLPSMSGYISKFNGLPLIYGQNLDLVTGVRVGGVAAPYIFPSYGYDPRNYMAFSFPVGVTEGLVELVFADGTSSSQLTVKSYYSYQDTSYTGYGTGVWDNDVLEIYGGRLHTAISVTIDSQDYPILTKGREHITVAMPDSSVSGEIVIKTYEQLEFRGQYQ